MHFRNPPGKRPKMRLQPQIEFARWFPLIFGCTQLPGERFAGNDRSGITIGYMPVADVWQETLR